MNTDQTLSDTAPEEEPGAADEIIITVPQPEEKKPYNLSRFQLAFISLIVFTLGLGAGFLTWGQETNSSTEPNWDEVVRFNVPEGSNPPLGPPNAPITLIEFGDFE